MSRWYRFKEVVGVQIQKKEERYKYKKTRKKVQIQKKREKCKNTKKGKKGANTAINSSQPFAPPPPAAALKLTYIATIAFAAVHI